MITRLEREKEERRNRRKRAKLEVSESAELEEKETEKECSVCLIEAKSSTIEAETAAAAGEYSKSSNEEDSDAKNEPKEESDKCSQSMVEPKPELTSAEDSSKTDEKTEGEDYEVERIVDYSWCRETVSGFCLRGANADNSHICKMFSASRTLLRQVDRLRGEREHVGADRKLGGVQGEAERVLPPEDQGQGERHSRQVGSELLSLSADFALNFNFMLKILSNNFQKAAARSAPRPQSPLRAPLRVHRDHLQPAVPLGIGDLLHGQQEEQDAHMDGD